MLRISPSKFFKRALNISVVGSGQMGTGIAYISLLKSHNLILVDSTQGALEKSKLFLDKLMEKDLGKGRITKEEITAMKSNVKMTTELSSVKNSDFVIEAIIEKESAKKELIKILAKIVNDNCVIDCKSSILPQEALTAVATNTSSISITKLASVSSRPQNVVGMHFMNPVPVMKLVEIIPGLATSSGTLQKTLDLATGLGKTTTVSQDVPGFIANRVLMPYINEAIYVLQENIGSRDDIDTTLKLGTGVPMGNTWIVDDIGPLRLADFIGLDTCLAIMRVLYNELGDCKYRPSPLLIKYVDAGYLGKKSGRGFYEY